jgi:signal transduction histidine kinase
MIFTIIIVDVILVLKNKIAIEWANGILIYSFFTNTILSLIINFQNSFFETYLYLSVVVYGILIFFVGFSLNKYHVYIIGVLYIIFFLAFSFLQNNNNIIDIAPLMTTILGAYIFGVNYIINLIDNYNLKQEELINNLKTQNKLLEKQGEELTMLNNTKNKLFSVLGHDLRTPANSIMGFAELISLKSESADVEAIKEYSNHIYQASNMLNNLLNQILDWARLQTGKIVTHYQDVHFTDIIDDVIDLMQGTVKLKNITVEIDIDSNIVLNCNKQMMATVIRNLVSNALKFTPENGKISIKYYIDDNKNFIFSIKDSGVGMDKEISDKLFKDTIIKSQRGTNNEKGTGLGLYICNGYIKMHNGKIWAESETGKGSTFYFSIPLTQTG